MSVNPVTVSYVVTSAFWLLVSVGLGTAIKVCLDSWLGMDRPQPWQVLAKNRSDEWYNASEWGDTE